MPAAYRDAVLVDDGPWGVIDASSLQPVESVTTVRVRFDRLHVADGPVFESGDQLGGYCVIDARDLNEANRLVAKLPVARYGSVEIRPIRELEAAPVPTLSVVDESREQRAT